MAPKRELEKQHNQAVSIDEIDGEVASSLPNKEVMSLLDVNANVDLGIDLAAPVDLAAAANLNIAAPIEAAASANVLSNDAQALAVAQQSGSITQGITGEANATAIQDASVTQGSEPDAGAATDAAGAPGTDAPSLAAGVSSGDLGTTVGGATGALDGATGTTVGDTVDGTVGGVTEPVGGTIGGVDSYLQGGNLLNADINIDADANLTAPVSGAVAANANVAAPINASVAANIGSDGAIAQSSAAQDVNITQSIDADAEATADQNADVSQ